MASSTVGGLFLDSLARFPARSFLRHRDRSAREQKWTYREAAGRLAAIVRRLEAQGLARGQRVVCFAEDMEPSVFLQLACAHLGVTTVFVSPLFSIELLGRLAKRLDARFVFTTAEHAPRLAGLSLAVEVMRHDESLPEREAEQVLRAANANVDGDDVYIMQPTSGSTGDPKLAMRTQRSMVRSAHHHALGMSPDDEPAQRILMVASLTHAFGQSILASAVWLGAEVAVPDAVDVSCSLDVVRALDPTYLLMPPRVMRAFDQQSAPGERLFGPSARLLQFTGAPGDADLLARIAAQGVNIVEMYGSTETGQLAMTRPGSWRPGVVGPPLPDVQFVIADDGELLARSPGRMVGYFADDKLTAEAFTPEGLYRTGDYAELTQDGMLRILGRKRDVFNTQDGANIYPARVETLIEALPWVRQVVLIGDQRPFVIALVTVEGEHTDADDGWVDPAQHAATYARARADLVEINAGLEPNERVRRFALFATPMPAQLYAHANLGKTRRDRRGLSSAYAARIEALYESSVPAACVVPER